MLSLRAALDLAASHRLAALKVEWWLDLPGSPLCRHDEDWERSLVADGVPVGDLAQLPQFGGSALTQAERRLLTDTISIVGFAQRAGTVVGPLLVDP